MLRFAPRSVHVQPLYACRAVASARLLHLSPVVNKSLTDKVTEAAGKVGGAVSEGLASAIGAGERATQTAKESMSSVSEDAKSKAEHMTEDTKQNANKLARQVKRGTEDELKK